MHFFVEKDFLTPQSITEQFGPVDGQETQQYCTTSRFQLSGVAKAFAPVKGQLIVQQNSTHSHLVNAILKPIQQVKLHNIAVKYFIFRGLTKDSFIQSGTPDAIVTSGSEFIQTFWANYYDWINKMDTPPPIPTAEALGYDQETIDDEESIRSLYMNAHNVRSVVVNEGMWIGNFTDSATIGVDIVLADSSYFPEVELARKHENIID